MNDYTIPSFDFSILTYSVWPWLVLALILVVAVVLFIAAETSHQATPVAEPVQRDSDGFTVIEP